MTADVFRRETCRLCGSADLELAVPLNASAVADAYLPPDRAEESRARYALDLSLCLECGHVQLLTVLSPDVLFRSYTYRTSSSLGLVEHFRNYAEAVHEVVSPPAGALALEIGSNDGTLLRFFQQRGMRVLGVDPAREIAAQATAAGVETVPEFFTSTLADQLLTTHGKAHIIAANNVFAHADALGDIADGVRTMLAADGLFIFEVSYLADIVERQLFDTVYHEHLCYHSVRPLVRFLDRHGLQLIDVQRLQSKGGSLRCLVQLARGPRAVEPSVAELCGLEKAQALDQIGTFQAFTTAINTAKEQTREKLQQLRSQGVKIAGFGASATVTTLLHHFELAEFLEFLVDDNQSKWGLLSPGHHLEVRSPQALADEGIGCVVILAWVYAENILKKHHSFLESGGRFVVPLPSPRVLGPPTA